MIPLFDMFQYGFMVRAIIAGIVVAAVCPLVGIFLVLRRYSMLADTLAHVSFAGVALGLYTKINPIITTLITSTVSAIGIERLRESHKVFGETALSVMLSGSLAVALVLMSWSSGTGVAIGSYLFGSIMAVSRVDLFLMILVGCVTVAIVCIYYKELVFSTFDEDTAHVKGIPVRRIHLLLIILTTFTVTVSMKVVGVLLLSALLVIPVVTAFQLHKGFRQTLIWAEVISFFDVLGGITLSYYANLPPGASIILWAISVFVAILVVRSSVVRYRT